MFWSIKSKWLDELFPWRRGVCDWELKKWQRPFLAYCGWKQGFYGSLSRLFYRKIRRSNKQFWNADDEKKHLRRVLLGLLFVFGWFWIVEFLFWEFRRKFNLVPKPVEPPPSTGFLGEVGWEEMNTYLSTLTDDQFDELFTLFQKHIKGKVFITKLEDIVLTTKT